MNEHHTVGMLLDLGAIPSVSFMTILPGSNQVSQLSLDEVLERATHGLEELPKSIDLSFLSKHQQC